jgi:plastocyanin
MNHKRVLALMLLAALALLPLHRSDAGGWASVEIVDGPTSIEAGEPVTFDLVIKQHGISPVDIDPLVIAATNTATSESVEVTASHAEGTGNYTVEINFSNNGIWRLEATPGGFPPFDMGLLRVGKTDSSSALNAPAGSVTIEITGGMGSGQFEPGSVEISQGTLVVWTNDSVEGHTVVIDGNFESSGLIGPGAAYAVLFTEPGTYRYSCGPHPAMSGTIVVS